MQKMPSGLETYLNLWTKDYSQPRWLSPMCVLKRYLFCEDYSICHVRNILTSLIFK
jgi:hypothetical protein